MKTNIYIVGCIAVAVLMSACEKRIDIDIDDQQQKVVVKSTNLVGEDVAVAITLSRPIYGTFYVREGEDYFTKVTNATATLNVGGGWISATRSGNIYSFDHHAQPGEELTLKIVVPGHDAATTTATVPYFPEVSNVELTVDDTPTNYNGLYDGIFSFSMTDNVNTADFYSVRLHNFDTVIYTYIDTAGAVMAIDTSINDYYARFKCVDYLLVSNTDIDNIVDPEDPDATSTYYGKNLLFTDASFNGQTHEVTLTTYDIDYYDDYFYRNHKVSGIDYDAVDRVDTENHGVMVLEVSSLSRDLYLYSRTVSAYDDDELLGFFSEPVQIHSNIKDGIGIFGFSALRSFKFNR